MVKLILRNGCVIIYEANSLTKTPEFSKGWYAGIQNEVFLNAQNKENINDSFFDQNRVYAGLGYRFSKKIDLEAGYMYRYQVEEII